MNVYFELLLKIFQNVFLINFSYCINSLIKKECLKLKEQRNKIVFCHFWHQYLLKSKFIAITWQLVQPISLCLAQVLITLAIPDPSVTQVLRRKIRRPDLKRQLVFDFITHWYTVLSLITGPSWLINASFMWVRCEHHAFDWVFMAPRIHTVGV